jgi:hypothetical protein
MRTTQDVGACADHVFRHCISISYVYQKQIRFYNFLFLYISTYLCS